MFVLIQDAMYYGMSGRGPLSIAYAPDHYVEWGLVKALMTNALILGLTMVPQMARSKRTRTSWDGAL